MNISGNLCVSYIMTSQNEEAEDLMRKVERAEELKGNANGHCLHLCIVNLVIGTLCVEYTKKKSIYHRIKSIEHPKITAITFTDRCTHAILYSQ